jgi:superoxide dismutase, Fe-Mn family
MSTLDFAGNQEQVQQSSALDRREALASIGLGAAAVAGFGPLAFAQDVSPVSPSKTAASPESLGWDPTTKQYALPKLPYSSDALEPHMDKHTMELHHGKHHLGYVDGLNKALKTLGEIRTGKRDASDIKHWMRELAFNGSGHFLHVLFWNSMESPSKGAGGSAKGNIAKQIEKDFGSYKQFSDQFQASAAAVEGSGWGILVWEPVAKQLLIMQSEKHQNLTAWGVQPLLPIDVWEHAYYLKYQNKRKDYVAAFMNVINWDAVEQRFNESTNQREA